MFSISIFSIIVYKYSYWQEFCQVILLKINKNLEVYNYYTILTLILAINLNVKLNKKLILNMKKLI